MGGRYGGGEGSKTLAIAKFGELQGSFWRQMNSLARMVFTPTTAELETRCACITHTTPNLTCATVSHYSLCRK